MPSTNQNMAASRKRPMVPGAGCARMCTRRRPVCCVCSGTVCSIVLGCPFRFYCRAAHSAANGDRSGATTAPTLCLAAPLAAARPTRIQRPRRRHRRDAARYDHSRPRPASLPLSSVSLPATPLSGSTHSGCRDEKCQKVLLAAIAQNFGREGLHIITACIRSAHESCGTRRITVDGADDDLRNALAIASDGVNRAQSRALSVASRAGVSLQTRDKCGSGRLRLATDRTEPGERQGRRGGELRGWRVRRSG